jgi:hypothetical protein
MKLNAVFAAVGLLFVTLSPIEAQTSKRPYVICKGTESPDGRYVVAWSLEKDVGWDWDKLNEEETSFDEMPNMDDVVVEGRIVNVESGAVMAKFPCDYWVSPSGGRPNRHFLNVAWSADSQFVVVAHQLRFTTASMDAIRFKDGVVAGQLSFCDTLEKAVRAHLKKSLGKSYDRYQEAIVVGFGDLKSLGGGKYSVASYSGEPKRMDPKIPFEDDVVTFEVTPGPKGKLALKLLSIKKTE